MVQYSTTVDRAFAALADPTRRAVLERLGTGSASISELAEPYRTPSTPPNASRSIIRNWPLEL